MASVQPTSVKAVIGASPNDADMAIVSVDVHGTPGYLNQMVLKAFGYDPTSHLPSPKELKKGYDALLFKDKKPVVFVVTVGKGNVLTNLQKNLYAALLEYAKWISGKKVWIPLLGTGAGELEFDVSYSTIGQIISDLPGTYKAAFTISIPDDKRGREFWKTLPPQDRDEPISAVNAESEGFIIGNTANFFIGSTYWKGNDQADRFFEEGRWENWQADRNEVVKSVKPGDILFLRAPDLGKLQIRGMGVVFENPHDGHNLKVDWKLTITEYVDIAVENPGKYDFAIGEVQPADVDIILKAIDVNRSVELGSRSNESDKTTPSPRKSTIADLIGDVDTGDDYLDINQDVIAFSKIMAAKSFQPPLAIALFGKWGSGKSFFMKKLISQITELPQRDPYDTYCKGIAQIRFNAWSYLDANLWASIVTRIFEGLHEYIANDTKANQFKREIAKDLTQELTIAREEVGLLETQRKLIAKQITDLNAEKRQLDWALLKEIDQIGSKTLRGIIENVNAQFHVKQRINEALQSNESFVKTEKELKEIIPEKYWDDPAAAYNEIRSKHTFLKEFFRRDRIGKNLIWAGMIIIGILTIPPIVQGFSHYMQNIDFTIPQIGLTLLVTAGALWKRAETTYKKLQPLVTSFWNIKNEYDKQLNDAIFQHEQSQKALQIQIERKREEVNVINQKLQQANLVMADLDFKINNALATEALYSFIERRSTSEDYKKYLGIVSVIRNDFQVLSDLLDQQQKEKSQRSRDFQSKFDKPLERIILYIDDLDRCPEDRVVEVLEAVNLLMAFSLFIVVVGVDPRWIKNALIKRHYLQFAGRLNGDPDMPAGMEIIDAANYLEKIFQVPFHMKEAKDDSVKHMLKTLSTPRVSVPVSTDAQTKSGVGAIPAGVNDGKENPPVNIPGKQPQETQAPTAGQQAAAPAPPEKPERLALTPWEIESIQEMSGIIGNNPRAIKRFVNVYQIVRAHAELHIEEGSEDMDYLAIMFLLAMSIGPLKPSLRQFKATYNSAEYKNLELGDLLDKPVTSQYLGLKDQLQPYLKVVKGEGIGKILRRIPFASFAKLDKFTRRFTFDEPVV